MKKKIVSLVLVFALALALGIGGTVAWLTATSDEVVNTFTVGDINIALTETDADVGIDTNTDDNNNEYHFVPGDKIAKDPKVTVTAGSEACWLFVKVEEANNTITNLNGKVINWSVKESDDEWKKLTSVDNVWYREVDASSSTENLSYYILSGTTTNPNGEVTVNSSVTKAMVSTINADDTKPALKFTAYAIQSANLTDQDNNGTVDAADAWALVSAN